MPPKGEEMHLKLIANLKVYKEHLGSMIKSNQKFEADALLLTNLGPETPTLMNLLEYCISPYLLV